MGVLGIQPAHDGGLNDEARSNAGVGYQAPVCAMGYAHRWGDGVTENSILERLAIRLQQADDPRAVMAATKRDDIVAHFNRPQLH